MANEAKLKLIHLVYGLLAAAVVVGIAIGSLMNQQDTNTDNIDRKVGREVFSQHEKYQNEQFKEIKDSLVRIEKKL